MKVWAWLVGASSCLMVRLAGAGVVQDWDELVVKHLIEHKVGSNPASRVLAAVHLAQYRAVEEVAKAHGIPLDKVAGNATLEEEMQVAVASAGKVAVPVLAVNVTNSTVDNLYQTHLKGRDATFKLAVDKGAEAAHAVLAERADDGSKKPANATDFRGSNETGKWRPIPPLFAPAVMPYWAKVKPFAMSSPSEFRSGPPPDRLGPVYRASYDEVFRVGNATSSNRTAEQDEIAKFWAFGPELLWARVTQQVTANMSTADAAKLFAAATAAAADSRIAVWDSKYYHEAWRPVTAIRVGNEAGWESDPNWNSFEKCPSTPEYPSAHTATAAAVALVLANFTGTDSFHFSLSSPSFANGTKARSFASYSAAVNETSEARVWGGMHFRHAIVEGKTQGDKIGQKAIEVFLVGTPRAPSRRLRAASSN